MQVARAHQPGAHQMKLSDRPTRAGAAHSSLLLRLLFLVDGMLLAVYARARSDSLIFLLRGASRDICQLVVFALYLWHMKRQTYFTVLLWPRLVCLALTYSHLLLRESKMMIASR